MASALVYPCSTCSRTHVCLYPSWVTLLVSLHPRSLLYPTVNQSSVAATPLGPMSDGATCAREALRERRHYVKCCRAISVPTCDTTKNTRSGGQAISWLLGVSGASACLLEASIPYSLKACEEKMAAGPPAPGYCSREVHKAYSFLPGSDLMSDLGRGNSAHPHHVQSMVDALRVVFPGTSHNGWVRAHPRTQVVKHRHPSKSPS